MCVTIVKAFVSLAVGWVKKITVKEKRQEHQRVFKAERISNGLKIRQIYQNFQ
jgi:hypothetical protein